MDGQVREAIAALPDALLLRAVQAAYAPAPVLGIGAIGPDDPYAHTRSNPLPASARRILLDDPGATWVHMDAGSGRILSQMDDSRRLYRWLYSGLHSFDLPLLAGAGPVREGLMLAALAAGLLLAVSAVLLAGRRLRRVAARRQGRT